MRTAICTVVKNEARDLAEWMAFHQVAGFGTQIIFDNNSTDLTRPCILAGARLGDVRYHHWGRADAHYQVDAYFTACQLYRHEFDWIAFIDADEFVLTGGEDSVEQFLARFHDCGGVGLNWAVYGSSGHIEHPAGLLTESFLHRSRPDFFPNRHIKSIVRPLSVMACHNPHWFDLDARYVGADGETLEWLVTADGETHKGLSRNEPNLDGGRINHYFTRSHAHWLEKLRRGYPADIAVRRMEEFAEYDRNEVFDDRACRHLAAVKQRVAAIRGGLEVE